MRIKDFKVFLKDNEGSISNIRYLLPDDSEVSSKQSIVPAAVENHPFFSAVVTTNEGKEEEEDFEFLVTNPRAISENSSPVEPPKQQIVKPGESLEAAQNRQFYESMISLNNMAYGKIFDAFKESTKTIIESIRENEKVIDRRLRMYVKDIQDGSGEDSETIPPSTPNDQFKIITDAVVETFQRIKRGDK